MISNTFSDKEVCMIMVSCGYMVYMRKLYLIELTFVYNDWS